MDQKVTDKQMQTGHLGDLKEETYRGADYIQ